MKNCRWLVSSAFVLAFAFASPASEQPAAPKGTKPRLDLYGDPLPEHAVLRIGTVRLRPCYTAQALAFTSDDKRLVTKGHVWDAATGKQLLAFGPATALSPDGSLAIVCGKKWTIHETATGRILQTIDSPEAHWESCISHDNKLFISMSGFMVIYVWDIATGKLLRKWEEKNQHQGHGMTAGMAISPDGKTLAVGSQIGPITLWDLTTGQQLRRLRATDQDGHQGFPVFSPDGKLVAGLALRGSLPNEKRRVAIWDAVSGKELHRLGQDDDSYRRAFFIPDGKSLAVMEWNEIQFWDTATGKLNYTVDANRGCYALAFSGDGKRMAIGYWSLVVRILDVATGKPLHHFDGPQAAGVTAWFTHDGKTIVSTNAIRYSEPESSLLRFWDTPSGKPSGSLGWDASKVTQTCISGDGRLFAALDQAGKVRIQQVRTGADIRVLAVPEGWKGGHMQMSAQGSHLAIRTKLSPGDEHPRYYGVHVWDLATGGVVLSLKGKPSDYFFFQFTDDGRFLAVHSEHAHEPQFSIGPDGYGYWAKPTYSVQFWHLRTGRKVAPTGPKWPGEELGTLSPSGRMTAIFESYGDTIVMHEMATGRLLCRLSSRDDSLTALCFSPDGRTIAASSSEGAIVLWDLAAQKRLTRLQGHRHSVNSVSFSPDGRQLVSGSDDATILVWDVSRWTSQTAGSPRPLSTRRAAKLWNQYTNNDDGAAVFAAFQRLLQSPKETVVLLRNRLGRAGDIPAKQIRQHIAQLDSSRYAEREQASANLQKLGMAAVPALERALQNQPTFEVRLRLERLLDKFDNQPMPRERLALSRGLDLLEMLGTAAARELLEEFSHGEADAWLTQEAAASLARLRKCRAP